MHTNCSIYGIMKSAKISAVIQDSVTMGWFHVSEDQSRTADNRRFLSSLRREAWCQNRWVKLAAITPWDRIEEYYLQTMSQETGRGEISARIAFGAISLRQSERLSDEDTVRYIQENPYVQYYLGLHEFHMEPLFDPSMMVHFRKRFPIEFIAKVNEYVCTGK